MDHFPETPDATDCFDFLSGLDIIPDIPGFLLPCQLPITWLAPSSPDFSLFEPLQVWRPTCTASCSDSTSHPASSWRLWMASWAMTIQRSPWSSRCTAGPARGRTMPVSSLQIIFTRREWTASLCTFSHPSSTFHTQVSWKPTRYDG